MPHPWTQKYYYRGYQNSDMEKTKLYAGRIIGPIKATFAVTVVLSGTWWLSGGDLISVLIIAITIAVVAMIYYEPIRFV